MARLILIAIFILKSSFAFCDEIYKKEEVAKDRNQFSYSLGFIGNCLKKFNKPYASEVIKDTIFVVWADANKRFKHHTLLTEGIDLGAVKEGENMSENDDSFESCKEHFRNVIKIGNKYEMLTIPYLKYYLNDE